MFVFPSLHIMHSLIVCIKRGFIEMETIIGSVSLKTRLITNVFDVFWVQIMLLLSSKPGRAGEEKRKMVYVCRFRSEIVSRIKHMLMNCSRVSFDF